MKKIAAVFRLLGRRFNLHEDKAEETEIVDNIRKDVSFKGANLWTLIFAIFIASIGLNINSTAVIIGAMLISPLMGPIMGAGLAIGTNDIGLLKKGIKNLSIAVVLSILTSALYFYFTPLHDASSELLARTTPSIWDVFVAILGGLAGIVAGTRKAKTNVIPGVAIATALMPPLCTVGYGLAMGRWYYFFGALYLFFINTVFICLSTFLIVRHLKFQKFEFETRVHQKRIVSYIAIIVLVAVLPSIYLTYRLVQRSIFEDSAQKFVQKEFNFERTQVVKRTFNLNGSKRSIELLLIGQDLTPSKIDSLKQRMAVYRIADAALVIRQGLTASRDIDFSQIRASVMDDALDTEPEDDTMKTAKVPVILPDLTSELKILYPAVTTYSASPAVFINTSEGKKDSLFLFTATASKPLKIEERQRLAAWLKQRLLVDSVHLVIENP